MTIPGPESNLIALWDFRVEIDGDFALATRKVGARQLRIPGPASVHGPLEQQPNTS